MDMELSAAILLSRKAHSGQVRKYTGEPYLSHPYSVAGLVASVSTDDDLIIAALLHDTVEDTYVTIERVSGMFGQRIASLVSDLTDISNPEDGNRVARKAIDREHTASASPDAKTIKLADLIDNTKSITACAPGFAKVYMNEKKLLLEVLKDGDETLYGVAERLVKEYFSKLEIVE